MRTLTKPPKTKKIQKQAEKQPQKKAQSKKITKTIFSSPFCYKIQTLSHEDTDELKKQFLPYLNHLRVQMPIKPQNNIKQKFISFKASQNPLPTLTSPEIILGVKSCIRALKQVNNRPQLVIVFYEQNRQQILDELFCRLLKQRIPLIIIRNDQKIKNQLAVKTLTCIGLKRSLQLDAQLKFLGWCRNLGLASTITIEEQPHKMKIKETLSLLSSFKQKS